MNTEIFNRRACLSVEETADSLGLSVLTVRRMCEDGRLRCLKAGSRTIIPVAAIQSFLEGSSPVQTAA